MRKYEDGRERYRITIHSRADAELMLDALYLPATSQARLDAAISYLENEVRKNGQVELAVLSMGNPHAVQRVADVREAPVAELGPRIEQHRRFARKVNAGFMQVVSRRQIAEVRGYIGGLEGKHLP